MKHQTKKGLSAGRIGARVARAHAGMTIVEVVIGLVLMSILVVAGLSVVTMMDRSSRREALHTSAMEMAQGRIEELQATPYVPPKFPFCTTNTIQTSNVVLSLFKNGTNAAVSGAMTTTISPVARGHLVNVLVATTNANQPLNVALQTVINEKSGNQP